MLAIATLEGKVNLSVEAEHFLQNQQVCWLTLPLVSLELMRVTNSLNKRFVGLAMSTYLL